MQLAFLVGFLILVKQEVDPYLSAVLVVAVDFCYLWQRNRHDYHVERMAQIKVDQIERKQGQKVREQARKRLTKQDAESTGAQTKGNRNATRS